MIITMRLLFRGNGLWCGLKLARTSRLSVVEHGVAELREHREVWKCLRRVCLARRRPVTTALEGCTEVVESTYCGLGSQFKRATHIKKDQQDSLEYREVLLPRQWTTKVQCLKVNI